LHNIFGYGNKTTNNNVFTNHILKPLAADRSLANQNETVQVQFHPNSSGIKGLSAAKRPQYYICPYEQSGCMSRRRTC